jgi:allophanate hydrolase
LLAGLPEPMALGPVRLAGGATAVGFGCEPLALVGAPDITHHRSWPAYLASATPVG